ncbi:hypothetical protein [Anaerotalea alkaliphila]|uniref:Uncharacterized protein n=1 Tax=Anaerotalea alkaliphila TaxID=2662126 RepID=A0A7X5KNJ7_9FIRM|nr:hypothetical protein [Anaerotalea alkaliphila]NDL68099.1 hypothetical protein [Anaerotalea alkaliphila]
MYTEICKREKVSFLKVLLAILLFSVGATGTTILFLSLGISRTIADLLVLFVFFLGTYHFMMGYVRYYEYMYIEDEFIIKEKMGTKDKVVGDFYLSQIIEIGPLKNLKSGTKYFSKRKFYSGSSPCPVYYILLEENDRQKVVLIKASDKLFNLLKNFEKYK